MIRALFSMLIAALYSVAAFAADPFTVAGVAVDAQGDTMIGAQTTAISEGQLRAANILIERLTLESERAAKPTAPLDIETAAKLIRAMSIANERRSAKRYLGDITVAFNPSAMRAYLSEQGLNMISTQTRMRLVLPVQAGEPLWSDNEWSTAWQTDRFTHALTPMRAAASGTGGDSVIDARAAQAIDMDRLAQLGQIYGVNQILVAVARPSFEGVSAQITDIALDTGQRRDLGSVSAPDFNTLAYAVTDSVESEWKSASATSSQNAVTTNVSVLYNSHADWQRLQKAINGSSQILGARLDALSKDGAMMTITYGGDLARLSNELSFKGVRVSNEPNLGTVFALSSYRFPQSASGQ